MKKVILVTVSIVMVLGLGACTGDDKAVSLNDTKTMVQICEEMAGEGRCGAKGSSDTTAQAVVPKTEPAPVVVNNYDSPAPVPSSPATSSESEPVSVSVVAHTPVKIDGPPTGAKPVPGDENVYFYFRDGRCKLASQGEPSATAKAFHRKGCPDTVS